MLSSASELYGGYHPVAEIVANSQPAASARSRFRRATAGSRTVGMRSRRSATREGGRIPASQATSLDSPSRFHSRDFPGSVRSFSCWNTPDTRLESPCNTSVFHTLARSRQVRIPRQAVRSVRATGSRCRPKAPHRPGADACTPSAGQHRFDQADRSGRLRSDVRARPRSIACVLRRFPMRCQKPHGAATI